MTTEQAEPAEPAQPIGPADAVCVGESMALVTPDPPAPLASGGPMRLDVAGAESTVACYLAQLGVRAAWISRVGDDPLGVLVRERVAGYGVDVTMVDVDPGAQTGVFFKNPGPAQTTVHYYRTGSAASRLGPDVLGLLESPRLASCRLVHLTGITPALSSSCAELVARCLTDRPIAGAVYCFDVNYRPALWPVDAAAPVLARLADLADVTFVGLDEAHLLWGAATPADVRAILPGSGTLVVKNGSVGATSYGPTGRVFVPAPAVEVVEPVGAGDAFAAGYLFGLLRDLPELARLRLGHLVARAALSGSGDVGALPPAAMLLTQAAHGGSR